MLGVSDKELQCPNKGQAKRSEVKANQVGKEDPKSTFTGIFLDYLAKNWRGYVCGPPLKKKLKILFNMNLTEINQTYCL